MRRKDLEITLSVNVRDFDSPKVDMEQYGTPARVAANLVYRAYMHGDIAGKKVLDICAGTGMLGIAAALMGAKVTVVELDRDALKILEENAQSLDLELDIIEGDVFSLKLDHYDTSLLNPPFGIQQKTYRDLDFLASALNHSDIAYSIHDGSVNNQNNLPDLLHSKNITTLEMYKDEFPLKAQYSFHTRAEKLHHVLVLRSQKTR